MGTKSLLGCLLLTAVLSLSSAGLVKKILRHRRQTLVSSGEDNITLPSPGQPVVFNHVYNINVPASAMCSHTADKENQIVFTHRINIPRQACGCADDLPELKALLSRLEMLEGELSTLREQCNGDANCCSAQVTGRCEDGDCVCDEPWTGFDCSELICPKDCYDRGRCDNGTCYCDTGYTGEDCGQRTCPNDCQGNGFCIDGQCVCTAGYSGEDCSKLTCLNDCNGRGTCFNGMCICDSGYQGEDCSQLMLVTDYLVTYAPTSPGGLHQEITVPGDKMVATIKELEPGIEYMIHVYAILSNKRSVPVSARVATRTSQSSLSCFTSEKTTLSQTDDSITLQWSNSLITAYKLVYVSRDGRSEEVVIPATATTHVLTNLTPGMVYTVTLTAERGQRRSAPATLYASTGDIKDAPTTPQSALDTGAVQTPGPLRPLASQGPSLSSSGGMISGEYNVSLNVTSYKITGLRPSTDYVAYLYGIFKGSRTSAVSIVASTDVDPPRDLAASNIQTDSATVTWKPPRAAVTGYTLTFSSADATVRVCPSACQLKYTVRLQAIVGPQKSRPVSTIFSTIGKLYRHPKDCAQALLNGETTSGLYTIYLEGEESQPIQVYCDMTTDGGGWMVFLRRQNGKLEFFRNWKNYTAGFGNMNDEFWLGLSNLHKITSSGQYELRVDLRDNGETAYAQYDKFSVAEPRTRYKVYIGGYSGTAGDSMTYHQGRPFSTYDNDNDIAVTNCALSYKGAFWYKNCHRVNLMGKYGDNSHSKGINWFHWKGHEHSIEYAEMKIRPANFRNFESRRKRS
uniref:Tenascin Ca n=1 Tax=Myripristis murdjan TaxID=586833 RepID=A0A667XCH4_9TELE